MLRPIAVSGKCESVVTSSFLCASIVEMKLKDEHVVKLDELDGPPIAILAVREKTPDPKMGRPAVAADAFEC